MKVKKLVEEILSEADDIDTKEVKSIDPNESSVDEIADVVQAGTEEAGQATVSNVVAKEIAKEVKDAAKGIDDTEYIPLVSTNALVSTLDKLFRQNSRNRRNKRTRGAGTDLLVNGLPGSGKTAIVRDWAKSRGCNLFYLNAKNKDLDAILNGYPVPNINADRDPTVIRAFSSALDPLDRENSILFLDEFNRADPRLRAVLLTLINEHAVDGGGKDGYRHFNNLLFTVACINPSVPTDPGAMPLSDAEKSRFKTKLNFDSTPAAALSYYNQYFPAILADLNTKDSHYAEDYIFFAKAYDLAKFIVKDPSFNFDSRSDLEDLDEENATMLNQRSLTDGLISDGGDGKDAFLDWVNNESEFLARDKEMLANILNKYTDIEPEVPGEQAKSNNAKNNEVENTPANSENKSTNTDEFTDDDFDFDSILNSGEETDVSLFGKTNASGAKAISETEAMNRIKAFKW